MSKLGADLAMEWPRYSVCRISQKPGWVGKPGVMLSVHDDLEEAQAYAAGREGVGVWDTAKREWVDGAETTPTRQKQ